MPLTVSLPEQRGALTIRDTLAGFILSISAAMIVNADELPQSWVPAVLDLPTDYEVVMDRTIGSTVQMFSLRTAMDVTGLLAQWSDALDEDGYTVRAQAADLESAALEFSGRDLLNAKIAINPTSQDGATLITFDATLR